LLPNVAQEGVRVDIPKKAAALCRIMAVL